jgi:hypothetical protein
MPGYPQTETSEERYKRNLEAQQQMMMALLGSQIASRKGYSEEGIEAIA